MKKLLLILFFIAASFDGFSQFFTDKTANKLQKGIDQVNVKEAWETVMGKGVYGYTDEVVFKKNTLFIRLSSATLREELSYGKEKIIAMLNEKLGKAIISKLKLL